MEHFTRYAVYFAPREGNFATRAAAWLGAGAGTPPVELPPAIGRPIADLTAAPRKYGFHGTLRAPFRPSAVLGHPEVCARVERMANQLKPVQAGQLQVVDLHGFLALVPSDTDALNSLAAQVVIDTDALRAPMTPDDIARRCPDTLTARQRALLERWGYPFVMEAFRFHLTLTDQLLPQEVAPLQAYLTEYFAPVLPQSFCVEDLCLFGEDTAGRFHLLHRYTLSG